MLQLGQITALGTVVFTAILLMRNAVAWIRLGNDPSVSRLPFGSGVVTQVIVWGAGILAVYLVDFTGLGGAFSIGGKSVVALGGWAKVMIGLMSASTLSTVNEIKKALDNTDSAKAPPLLSTHDAIKNLATTKEGLGADNLRVRHVVDPGGTNASLS
jgi:hypothetical protein